MKTAETDLYSDHGKCSKRAAEKIKGVAMFCRLTIKSPRSQPWTKCTVIFILYWITQTPVYLLNTYSLIILLNETISNPFINSNLTFPRPLKYRSISQSRSKVPAVSTEKACILV